MRAIMKLESEAEARQVPCWAKSADPAREIQMNWLECEEAGDGMVQFYHF